MKSETLQQTGPSVSKHIPVVPFGGRRLPELDSVRGLASVTVVLLHFHDMWMPTDQANLPVWLKGLLLLLRPFYSGSEAVILFFVLSGLVLSLPYLRGRAQAYPRYLVRRLLRIYGPYVAALVLAVSGAAIWNGHAYHGEWAATLWSDPLDISLIAQHIAFIGVYDWSKYDFVIWSLIQEMRISIVFPFVLAMVTRIGGGASVILGLVLSSIAMAFVPIAPDVSARFSLFITLHFIAFFIVGIVLASRLERVKFWWNHTSSRIHWILACCSLFVYGYDWPIIRALMRVLDHRAASGAQNALPLAHMMIAANWISMLGAAGLIVVALNATFARRVLNSRPSRFLGRISYSLYLIHPVVLQALTFGCRDRISMWVQFPIYISSSLLLAWLLCLTVEERFIKWSRAV